MKTLIQAISEAEACDAARAAEILSGIGFTEDQFTGSVSAFNLESGATLITNDWGFILAGSSGEPQFSESLCDLLPPAILPEDYTEAVFKANIYRPDGFSNEDQPWLIKAAQAAAIMRAEGGSHEVPEPAEEYGEDWESGKVLVFSDGSIYYADGGRHEVWRYASDFESEYGDFRAWG